MPTQLSCISETSSDLNPHFKVMLWKWIADLRCACLCVTCVSLVSCSPVGQICCYEHILQYCISEIPSLSV